MNNVIEFPLMQIFEREDFDKSQEAAKVVAGSVVEKAENLEQYALTLAMVSGHALSFIRDKYPDVWADIGEALEIVACGGGLTHEK